MSQANIDIVQGGLEAMKCRAEDVAATCNKLKASSPQADYDCFITACNAHKEMADYYATVAPQVSGEPAIPVPPGGED